jgi:predicted nucleic acid-binding protein
MIFADSDFFIGLYLKEDTHHSDCLELIENIKDEFITSWDVVDEVTTKLAYYVNKKTAQNFFSDIMKNGILVVFPNPDLMKNAFQFFNTQKTSKVSLTDCMNMAIARDKGIEMFLSFDKVYEKNGFKLVKIK